jgi:hypothetical protein
MNVLTLKTYRALEKVKVKVSRYRPEQAPGIPGG